MKALRLPIALLTLAALLLALPVVCSAEHAVALAVIDGDTIAVRLDGTEERVRLIGIDAPESRPNDKARRDAGRTSRDLSTILELGRRSSAHLKSLLPRSTAVRLEFDRERRDRYGRLLAYVYLPDGTMLNERMVLDGHAALLTIPPNVRYAERLREAARAARGDTR